MFDRALNAWAGDPPTLRGLAERYLISEGRRVDGFAVHAFNVRVNIGKRVIRALVERVESFRPGA
jgi:hypothetical protein